jgi:hypothetical protein
VEPVAVDFVDPVALSSELRRGDTMRGLRTGAKVAGEEASEAAERSRCKCNADGELGPPSSA